MPGVCAPVLPRRGGGGVNRVVVSLAAVVAGAALLGFTSSHEPALCDSDASCAALGIGTGYGVTAEKVAQLVPVDGPVLVTEADTTPAVWECLRGLGYVGDPSDGVEALYAPASDVADCAGPAL